MPQQKRTRRFLVWILLSINLLPLSSFAKEEDELIGQTVKLETNLNSYVGHPIWLLEIRDVDRNKTTPYLFNINAGNNTWITFTHSRNYLITASRLQFPSFRSRYDDYKSYRINNFCHLESRGKIIRDQSIHLVVTGNLSPHSNTYQCQIFTYSGI